MFSLFSCRENQVQMPENPGEMNTFEALSRRKSVRSFTDKPIEEEVLKAIAEAGNMAAGTPTVGSRYFTVITDKDFLKDISKATKEQMGKSGIARAAMISKIPGYDPLFGATAIILISGDKQDNALMDNVVAQNAACAGENILLAATALGIGSHYVGSVVMAFNDESIRTRAALSDNMNPVCVILLGYTDDLEPHKVRPENPSNIHYVK